MKQNYFKKSATIVLVLYGLLSTIWATAQVNFKVGNILASSGDVIEVPVLVENFTEITAFQLEINIPLDKATFMDVTNVNTELFEFKPQNYNQTAEGAIKILWGDIEFKGRTVADGEPLFTIKMEVNTQEEVFAIDLNLSNAANTKEVLETTKESGSVSVDALQFKMEDQIVGVGTTFDIPVKAQGFLNVAGFQLKIQFPKEFAEFVTIENPNAALTNFGSANYYSPEPGLINVVWDEPSLVSTTIDNDAVLFTIQLKAADTAGTFPVDITNTSVFDNQPQSIFSIDSSADITIKEFVTVSGIVKNEKGEGVAKTLVTLQNSKATQEVINNNDGTFSFTALPGDNFELIPTREEEINNGINVADILITRQHILGQTTLSPYKNIAADVDNSLAVDVADIITIRKFLLGTVTSFYRNWVFTPESFSFPDPLNPLSTAFPNTIEYSILDENKEDQNFIAIKIGDVNDDHDVLLKGGEITTELVMEDIKVFSGNQVRIPVKSKEGYINIAGWQSTIEFNPDVLSFSKIESGVLPITTANYGMQKASEGKVAFVYDQQASKGESFTNKETLFYLVFDVIGASEDKSDISFTNAEIPTMTFSEGLIRGELAVQSSKIKVEELEVFVFPNPGTKFTIQFTTPTVNTVKWQVMNMSGAILFQEERNVEGGTNTIQFNAENLARGVYFLNYEIGNENKSQKIIVN
ncbi:cohesin domain-containing protein [Tenacibaculum agarivorans]|uniref:cohesin domain-containing protein n=1 Tax=Tenacibaculum agarivorans TaxID=1908389 RepID=UPI00094B7A8C|nr:cohesin domain-containing protein [Tenacibaculum agarivorans]